MTVLFTAVVFLLGVIAVMVAYLVGSIGDAPKQILIAIGTTLISTAVISVFFEWQEREVRHLSLSKLFKDILHNNFDLYGAAAREGITGIFPNRQACRFHDKISAAKRLVILQNYEATLAELEPAIERMLKDGGTLEFYYVDPHSAFADSRERQLKGKLTSFEYMVLDNLNILARLQSHVAPRRVAIREYSDLYPVQMFIIDKDIYFAIFWAEEHARNSVHFLLSDPDSPSYNRADAHYNYYRAHSKEIPDPERRLEEIKKRIVWKATAHTTVVEEVADGI